MQKEMVQEGLTKLKQGDMKVQSSTDKSIARTLESGHKTTKVLSEQLCSGNTIPQKYHVIRQTSLLLWFWQF